MNCWSSHSENRLPLQIAGFDRRSFLQSALSTTALAAWPKSAVGDQSSTDKPRVALILTVYRGYSHADVIAGRMLQGYILAPEETYWPRTQVVSMFVDQFPAGDLSRGMAHQYGVRMASNIEEALAPNGSTLDVDGVVIIGEHGDYPHNEKGQHMYPRRRFFEETVAAFRKMGRSVPVFNDKHLGFAWEDAKWMYDQARGLGFPLMAGSSLPTAWRKPDLAYPLGVDLEEALAIGYGGVEAYGFHALETLQCMIERRRGGESGVVAVTCLEGPAVWQAAKQGRWSRDLLDAVLKQIDSRPTESPETACPQPAAFLIEHADGFQSTVVMLGGYTSAFGFAGRERGAAKPNATHFWLQEPEFGHFSFLAHNIEEMVLQRREIYPPERTLLTTGVLDAVMTSRHERQRRVETPWLAKVAYNAPAIPGRRATF